MTSARMKPLCRSLWISPAASKAVAPHRVVDFVSEPADLEEIFLELYREADDGR